MKDSLNGLKTSINRRSFVKNGLTAAGAATVGAGLLVSSSSAFAKKGPEEHSCSLTRGDAAILRFMAAAEILETDLWQQYNELGGIQDSEVPGGSGNSVYTAALAVLDEDMDQYIHDNTEDELTHEVFINAYLASKGANTVNLDEFRTLSSSQATGAQQIGRLTNLMQLTVDTGWWTRYRSSKNPDFGDAFDQAVPTLNVGQHPAIPRTNDDLTPNDHIQAIANTASFHFGTIEQGGTSLYPSLAQRVTHPDVLRIVLSIGPTEAMHFQTWQDKAGNAPAPDRPEREFYAALEGPVVVGIEATGAMQWFLELLGELSIECRIGDPAKIRAAETRKQKHDRRDARLIWELLIEERFPEIWMPSSEERDLRTVLRDRHQWVKMRARLQHTLQAIALNHALRQGRALWSQAGQSALQALTLPPYTSQRRTELLSLYVQLQRRIQELDQEVEAQARQRPQARRLLTHPGVGAVTALATEVFLGDPSRFGHRQPGGQLYRDDSV